MHKISAVIITLNEERNIARCLQSLQGVADEVVVVDSGSTDGTEEICKQFGAKFTHQQWLGYSGQKNFANTLAENDYILSIDADEVLSEELKASILAINFTADAYAFNRLTNYCGKKWIKHCGWYPDTKIRLWKKGKAEWNLSDLHETVLLPPNTKALHLNGDLLHYTYHSISDHILQLNKFTEISAQALFKKKGKISVLQVIYKPLWKFLNDYFIKLGLLDGYYGFVICSISAFAVFAKYAKTKFLYDKKE